LALDAAGWRCRRCAGVGRLEVHHRVPIAQGGARFALDNLEVLCRRCHLGEHAAPDPGRAEWRAFIDASV